MFRFEINFTTFIQIVRFVFLTHTRLRYGVVRAYVCSRLCAIMARPIWVKSLPKIGMNDNFYDTYHTETFIATAIYFISSFVLVRIFFLSFLLIRLHSRRRPRLVSPFFI